MAIKQENQQCAQNRVEYSACEQRQIALPFRDSPQSCEIGFSDNVPETMTDTHSRVDSSGPRGDKMGEFVRKNARIRGNGQDCEAQRAVIREIEIPRPCHQQWAPDSGNAGKGKQGKVACQCWTAEKAL